MMLGKLRDSIEAVEGLWWLLTFVCGAILVLMGVTAIAVGFALLGAN